MKNALLIWSGGADSTRLLLDLLEDNRIRRVRTIAFNSEQIISSGPQKIQRKIIEQELRKVKKFNKKWLYPEEYMIGGYVTGDGLRQQPLFVSQGAIALREDEDLYLGYIRSDDFFHFKTEFKDIFNNIAHMKFCSESELKTPLEWIDKIDILQHLYSKNILHLIWTCGGNYVKGKYLSCKPCGECKECKTFILHLEATNIKKDEKKEILKKMGYK